MSTSAATIDQTAINTIRTLSMDAVQKANSGHPGTPMALAPVAYQLFTEKLAYDPANAKWAGRDRFVLSCGHASMLLYSLLCLSEVKEEDGKPSITIEDIQNFRQLHSPCAGHPEYGEAAGIETTTGPLGQGIANSVGMAIASKHLSARYDRDDSDLFSYNVYALCGDGDLMEGVGCEAASLAGHLKLDNLCWIYDDNGITIEGHTDLAYSEDVPAKYTACGWNVQIIEDANDLSAISAAISSFQACNDRPTLIVLRSVIGYGAPNKQNTHDAHGAPLGEDEIKLAKQFFQWPDDQKFVIPEEVVEHFRNTLGQRGSDLYSQWQDRWSKYQADHPALATEVAAILDGKLPADWESCLPTFEASEKGDATRNTSGKVLNALAEVVPGLIGGSADLGPSNKTTLKNTGGFSVATADGRNLHYGVREHVMGSIANGLALSGLRPFVGTFFVFTDYMRGAMRLSALMKQNVIYVLTHDSIGLGEDGPTHQPIEHLAACRAIPSMVVMRPGDENEVAQVYGAAMNLQGQPCCMVLSRQNMPTIDRATFGSADGAAKGGYVLWDSSENIEVILIGTGTELSVALEAGKLLADSGVGVRVVSMPSWELFEMQSEDYRSSVLPSSVTARVAVEAGIRQGWDRYIGSEGAFVGMDSFGASAPYKKLYQHFGITAENVVRAANAQLQRS